MSDGDRRREVVEGARVHVPGLQREDRRAVVGDQRVSERIDADAALLVGRHCLRCAESEVAQRQVDGVVALSADQHAHPRRALQAVLLDVPSGARQHCVPPRGQSGEVGHQPTGDGAHRGAGGQSEQLREPPFNRLARGAVGGRDLTQANVLVPGACQPVRGEGDRVGAADDEPEEARRTHGGQTRLGVGDEALKHLTRIPPRSRHRFPEGRQKIIGQDRGGNGPLIHVVEVRLGFVRCEIEQCVAVVHGPTLPPQTLAVQGSIGAGLSSKGD